MGTFLFTITLFGAVMVAVRVGTINGFPLRAVTAAPAPLRAGQRQRLGVNP